MDVLCLWKWSKIAFKYCIAEKRRESVREIKIRPEPFFFSRRAFIWNGWMLIYIFFLRIPLPTTFTQFIIYAGISSLDKKKVRYDISFQDKIQWLQKRACSLFPILCTQIWYNFTGLVFYYFFAQILIHRSVSRCSWRSLEIISKVFFWILWLIIAYRLSLMLSHSVRKKIYKATPLKKSEIRPEFTASRIRIFFSLLQG